MRQHKVGDRVRVNAPDSDYHGLECQIVSGLTRMLSYDSCKFFVVHEVDIPCPEGKGDMVGFEPRQLIPLDDPSEDQFDIESTDTPNKVVRWSDCSWQPRRERA